MCQLILDEGFPNEGTVQVTLEMIIAKVRSVATLLAAAPVQVTAAILNMKACAHRCIPLLCRSDARQQQRWPSVVADRADLTRAGETDVYSIYY